MRPPASYVIVDRVTGKAVAEFYDAAIVAKVNRARYDVMPILEYLYSLNRKGG
jgi:hypothetical protein